MHVPSFSFSKKTDRRLKRLAVIGAVALIVAIQPPQDPYVNRPFIDPMKTLSQFCILLLFCCLVTLIYLTWRMFNSEEVGEHDVVGVLLTTRSDIIKLCCLSLIQLIVFPALVLRWMKTKRRERRT